MTTASGPAFVAWGTAHLTVIACTIGAAWWMVRKARRHPQRRAVPEEKCLAFILLTNHLWSVGWLAWKGALDREHALPLHLCDAASIVAGIAILRSSRPLTELAWFWGIAGTLQSLITPVVTAGFPQPEFLIFFLHHCGVVVAAVYLVFGRGLHPQRGALFRAFGWIQLYLLVAFCVDHALQVNYGYLRAHPPGPTLMDLMPAPPWHIPVLEVLAFCLFALVSLPLRALRKEEQPESGDTSVAAQ